MKDVAYVMKLVKDYGVEGYDMENVLISKSEEDLESIKSSIEDEIDNNSETPYFINLYLTEDQKISLSSNFTNSWLEIEDIIMI